MSGNVTTLWFKAPEILLGDWKYGFSIDIWAAGCLFYFMSHFSHIFKGENFKIVLSKILSILGFPWEDSTLLSLPNSWVLMKLKNEAWDVDFEELCPNLPPSGIDLLSKMLRLDPAEWISADEAVKHEYFRELEAYNFNQR